MADILRQSRLATGIQRGIALNTNTIVVDNIKLKAGSGNDAIYATFSGSLSAVRTISLPDTNLDFANIAALVSLSGVAANAVNLGTFTGTTIPDNSTVKAALQALETAAEAGGSSDFSDSVFRISDNATPSKKIAFEASGISSSTVRTVTMPDTDVDLGDIATLNSYVSDLITLSGLAPNSVDLGPMTDYGIIDSSLTFNDAFFNINEYLGTFQEFLFYEVSGFTAGNAVLAEDTTILEALQRLDELLQPGGEYLDTYLFPSFTGDIIPDDSNTAQALQSLETAIESIPDPMEYKGLWNATTNSPALTDGTGDNGDLYQVTVAGTQFTPAITFAVGDKVVYNGATAKYEKWDMTESVASVFGRVGVVTAQSGDYNTSQVTENTNLYFTEARVRASLITGFVSGAGTVAATDSVLQAINKLDGNELALAATVAANSEKVVRTALLGEATISAGVKAFRWAKAADAGFAAGRLYLADNDATTVDNFHVCGLYVAAGTEVITNSLTITKMGKMTATGHGFTVGQPIWLDAAGALSSTAPTANSLAAVKVAMAETANLIDIQIEIFGVN